VRVAFLGTPDAAVPSLEALVGAADVEVVAVVTNPDRARGRSRRVAPPPVKVAAEAHGLPVWQPERPSEIVDDLAALHVDAAAVVAYGAILAPAVLAAGGRGFVNLHLSLLPRWRGAAPVQHAVRAGDEVTGVTVFVLDAGLDTGPMLAQVEVPIEPDEPAGRLQDRLARLGAPVLVDSLRRFVAGEEPTSQPEEGVTYAPKVTPDDVRIDWDEPADRIVNLARSADPAPGAHTTFRGERLKVFRARAHDAQGTPGRVVATSPAGAVVACGDGAVVLAEVQPAGKRRMTGEAFARGHRPAVGEVLGEAAA
jgi:methionyl-tRNA formyltransferase